MQPKLNKPKRWKAREIRTTAASTTHHAAWSHQTSVALMIHSRKTYLLPCALEGGRLQITYRRGCPISSSLNDYRKPRYQNDCRLAVCKLRSYRRRINSRRLRGDSCFAAFWYAIVLICKDRYSS